LNFTKKKGCGIIKSLRLLNAKIKELLRYEAALGRQLALDLCVLCIYDANGLEEKQVIQLNKYHGHEIFKDMALVTT